MLFLVCSIYINNKNFFELYIKADGNEMAIAAEIQKKFPYIIMHYEAIPCHEERA